MKFSAIRRILKENLQGEKPAWIEGLLSPLNEFMEQAYLALNGNLTFQDNIAAREISQKFEHGVEKEINPQAKSRVKGMLVIDCGGKTLTSQRLKRKDNGNVLIALTFAEGAGTKADCVIELILG